MSPIVRKYNTFKNIPMPQSMFNEKTLMNKLSDFNSTSRKKKKKEILSNSNSIPTQGNPHKKLQRVTDETVLCLITLVLDFLTFSTKSYTANINSPFGPNSEKKVSRRTIQRYLKKLKFTCKKASFHLQLEIISSLESIDMLGAISLKELVIEEIL